MVELKGMKRKVLITAYHCQNTVFGMEGKGKIKYLDDWFVIVGHHVVDTLDAHGMSNDQVGSLCDIAFNHFNWVDEVDMYAGETVNAICMFNGTHASMCAGDIVRIQYYVPIEGLKPRSKTRFFLCETFGWKELTE